MTNGHRSAIDSGPLECVTDEPEVSVLVTLWLVSSYIHWAWPLLPLSGTLQEMTAPLAIAHRQQIRIPKWNHL